MKHSRPDYDRRIQDADGLIPHDEPVFLLRAQDASAAAAVRAWCELAEARGVHPEVVQNARDHAELMEAWHKKKLADVPF